MSNPPSSPSPPDRPADSVDPKLLEILVCPLTKTPLEYDAERQELISRAAKRSGFVSFVPSIDTPGISLVSGEIQGIFPPLEPLPCDNDPAAANAD